MPDNIIQNDIYECPHDDTVLAKRVFSNGSVHYYNQCLICGRPTGSAIRHGELSDRDKLAAVDWNADIESDWMNERQRLLMNTREERVRNDRKDYERYLQSDKWKRKRLIVLKRDKYICQGCMKAQATEVHHLSYANIYNEFLFELTSLCADCHERYHNIERN